MSELVTKSVPQEHKQRVVGRFTIVVTAAAVLADVGARGPFRAKPRRRQVLDCIAGWNRIRRFQGIRGMAPSSEQPQRTPACNRGRLPRPSYEER